MKTMKKLANFKNELAECGITWHFSFGRIELIGKNADPYEVREFPEEYANVSDTVNKIALECYKDMLRQNPKFEVWFIREWAKENTCAGMTVKEVIEERAAIRQADGLPSDTLSAILCNFT